VFSNAVSACDHWQHLQFGSVVHGDADPARALPSQGQLGAAPAPTWHQVRSAASADHSGRHVGRRAVRAPRPRTPVPTTQIAVTTAWAPVYPRLIDELITGARHITEQYASNIVEADHGCLKARLRPAQVFKRLASAGTVATGHAFVQNVRRGR
jgi:DDE domain